IARALVRQPEIYLFDDSFSALDYQTDAKLHQKLEEETKDSTIIIVGQRVSSVKSADKILVLDKGIIDGKGTHNELIKDNKVYQVIEDSNIIIVGQRVSSVNSADQILVLDKGIIVGKGTHNELIKDNKVYQEIVDSQFDEGELV